MNVNQSYIRDVYSMDEVENIGTAKFHNDIYWKKRTVNGINYRDPDYNCDRLYNDANNMFFKGELVKDFDPNAKAQIVLLQGKYRLTTDYIGPSLTSMKRAGISDRDAWECTVKCRTVGGHLVWPRLPHGINPSKAASGKRGYGISDRIDIALYELKCVLDKNFDFPTYNKTLRNSILHEENMNWFNGKSFSQFCKDFYLFGSFVDEKSNGIIWFSDPIPQKLNVEVMKCYMNNNLDAIEERNRIMGRLIKVGAKS